MEIFLLIVFNPLLIDLISRSKYIILERNKTASYLIIDNWLFSNP